MPKKKTRVVVALERAKKSLTQEVLTQAMADLPHGTTIGEVVTAMRSAGFAKDFEAMSLRDFVAALGNGAARPPGRRRRRG